MLESAPQSTISTSSQYTESAKQSILDYLALHYKAASFDRLVTELPFSFTTLAEAYRSLISSNAVFVTNGIANLSNHAGTVPEPSKPSPPGDLNIPSSPHQNADQNPHSDTLVGNGGATLPPANPAPPDTPRFDIFISKCKSCGEYGPVTELKSGIYQCQKCWDEEHKKES